VKKVDEIEEVREVKKVYMGTQSINTSAVKPWGLVWPALVLAVYLKLSKEL
jgi:hypothetical protein